MKLTKLYSSKFYLLFLLLYFTTLIVACSVHDPKTVSVNPEALSEYDYDQSVESATKDVSTEKDLNKEKPLVTPKPRIVAKDDSTYNKAFKIIAKHEKFKSRKYFAPEKKYLIGYGFSCSKYKTSHMSKETADRILYKKIKQYDRQIDKLIKVELTSNERAALISFAYNVGIGNLQNSTLLRYINKNKKKAASNQFTLWVHCAGKKLNGLEKRRVEEKQLFLS